MNVGGFNCADQGFANFGDTAFQCPPDAVSVHRGKDNSSKVWNCCSGRASETLSDAVMVDSQLIRTCF